MAELSAEHRTQPRRPAPVTAAERRFSISDGLILIAAVALGLAGVRGWQNPSWCSYQIGFYPGPGAPASFDRVFVYQLSVGISWTIPFAMALSLAMLAIRLRRPRPSLRRVVRQPGTIACAAALAAILFRLLEESFCWVLGYLTRPQSAVHLPSPPFVRFDNPGFHPPPAQWFRNGVLETFPILVSPSLALAIAAGWIVLRTSGRWRPATGWIDRSSRLLGWYWIGLAIVLAGVMEVSKFIG